MFAIDQVQPTADELAKETCGYLLDSGTLPRSAVPAYGRGKILRKAVSTMLHMLVGCPMSDAQLYLRILHGRITWQRSYTIAQCTRHSDAWAALPATSRSIMQVQDIVRL